MKKLCIYHGNCADGFGAAWVVRKFWGEHIDFHAGIYGDAPPDVTDRDVIMVDFSYKKDVLLEMGAKARSITVIDHHRTAAADLEEFTIKHLATVQDVETVVGCEQPELGNIRAIFDMTHSGAMLSWKFFFPTLPPPKLIQHIEDRDLWLFKLTGTREIQASVFSYPYDFAVWDELMAMDTDILFKEGIAIERKHHKDVAELVGVTKRRMKIGGYDVPVANLPYTLNSDAGHLMGEGEPFAACYYDTAQRRCFSLRSAPDGVDVSEIARRYGGGGHKNAAGFSQPLGWEGEP